MIINSKQVVNVVLSGCHCGQIVYVEFAIDFDTIGNILDHETYVRTKAKTTIALRDGHLDEVCQRFKKDIFALYKALDGWIVGSKSDKIYKVRDPSATVDFPSGAGSIHSLQSFGCLSRDWNLSR